MAAILNRIILLLVAILAGIQIVVGIEHYVMLAIGYLTFSFGIFLISALLMLLMGVDIIEHDSAALAAATLPLGFSLGLVVEFFPEFHTIFLGLILLLFALLIVKKIQHKSSQALLLQVLLHGLSGLVLFILPIVLFLEAEVGSAFLWISVGTGLVATGGLALALLKSGRPVLTKDQIYLIFPAVLLLAVCAFYGGIGSY
jgi:hypothetical protein